MAGSSVNLKAAPRKEIVRIEKTGSWGQVEWLHHLECGHIESRKRKSSTKVLACTSCVLADRQKEQFVELSRVAGDVELLDELGSKLAVGERTVAQIRAALAARFAVPDDAVEVVVDDDSGTLEVSYAVVLLTLDEIRRLTA